MKYVWLLWGSEGGITETPWIEGVYASKVQAEADLRILEDAEATMRVYLLDTRKAGDDIKTKGEQ
jgi:hypothetical protein